MTACATIYLASRCLKSPLPDAVLDGGQKGPWWVALGPDARATQDELEDISAQILDLYEQSPTLSAIRAGGNVQGGMISRVLCVYV